MLGSAIINFGVFLMLALSVTLSGLGLLPSMTVTILLFTANLTGYYLYLLSSFILERAFNPS